MPGERRPLQLTYVEDFPIGQQLQGSQGHSRLIHIGQQVTTPIPIEGVRELTGEFDSARSAGGGVPVVGTLRRHHLIMLNGDREQLPATAVCRPHQRSLRRDVLSQEIRAAEGVRHSAASRISRPFTEPG